MHFLVFIHDNELAGLIGKKSSENGIVFVNRIIDGNIIVGMSVIDLEKKFYDVAQSMLLSNQIIISTKNIDKLFGELVIAAELCKKRIIFSDDSNIEEFVKTLDLDYIICNTQEIVNNIIKSNNEINDEETRIDIDNAFNVKGIGCVALGIVTKGKVNVHDSLYHSDNKQIIIKSIQSQDIDIKIAEKNTRVGVALKGINSSNISKGDILTKNPIKKVNNTEAIIRISKIADEKIEKGNRYEFISNFSNRVCIIDEIEDNKIKLTFEKSITLQKNDSFMLLRNNSPRIFGIGNII